MGKEKALPTKVAKLKLLLNQVSVALLYVADKIKKPEIALLYTTELTHLILRRRIA